jgi:hypothetical protein
MTLSYINCIFESIEIIFTLCKNENYCFSIFMVDLMGLKERK